MNAVDLRNKLQVLLAPELGRYSNGLPSIWVYGSASDPPSASNGLECLIKQVPSVPAQGSSGGQRYKPQEWDITLKNFKRDSNLAKALAKIEVHFVIYQYSHFPFTSTTFEQARIAIFDPVTINL